MQVNVLKLFLISCLVEVEDVFETSDVILEFEGVVIELVLDEYF